MEVVRNIIEIVLLINVFILCLLTYILYKIWGGLIMKKLSMNEGKAIGLAGLWAMIGVATLPILGSAVLTGTMANICYGIGIMQTVNILFLKDKEE